MSLVRQNTSFCGNGLTLTTVLITLKNITLENIVQNGENSGFPLLKTEISVATLCKCFRLTFLTLYNLNLNEIGITRNFKVKGKTGSQGQG